jgi:indole-3-glycerol phosphate synthase
VNARDLDTLQMDAERAAAVLGGLPRGVTAAHLSGVKTEEDVKRVAQGRADAALIGEVLMTKDDPTATLLALAQAAS